MRIFPIRKKYSCILLLILSFIISLYIFIQPVLRIVAKHCVQKYIPDTMSCVFTCGQVNIKRNAIILQNAHISLCANINNINIDITMDSIEIQFRPFLRLRCENPLVVCNKSQVVNSPATSVTCKNNIGTFPWRLEIENGILQIKDDNKINTYSFSLATAYRNLDGRISLSPFGEESCLFVHYLYEQNKIMGNLVFKELELSRFSSLLNAFPSLHNQKITGVTTGYLNFGKELSGKIICSDFTYSQNNFPIQMNCQQCELTIEEKNTLPIITAAIEKGSIYLTREEDASPIVIQGIRGHIGINSITELSANLQVGKHILPCILNGEGNRGEITFGNDSKQKIAYRINQESEGLLLSLDLDRIVDTPLLTIQYISTKLYPELEPFILESGIIDGKISLLWNTWRIEKVICNQLSLIDLVIRDRSRDSKYIIPKCSVEGQIDFLLPDVFHKFSGRCILSEGRIVHGGKSLVQEIGLHLQVKEGYLESSEISFGIKNSYLRGALSGLIIAPDFSFTIESNAQAIYELYSMSHVNNESITLHGQYIHGKTLTADCIATSLQEQLHIEIALTAMCNLWRIIAQPSSNWYDKITFFGNNLSSFWYENFIHYIFPETSICGFIDMKGHFVGEELQLCFSSLDLQYRSPQVSFSDAKFSDGHLYWKQNQPITLHIPTIEMQSTVHNMNLQIDRAIGELYIENENIFFKKVKAELEDLSFSGNISLIQQIDDSVKLSVEANAFQGSLKKLLSLTKKSSSFPQCNIPLEGTVISTASGFYLESHFTEKNTKTTWQIEANIENASCANGCNGMLDALQFHIEINSEKGILALDNLHAIYKIDQSFKDLSYRVYIPKIECCFLESMQCAFDVRLTTDTYDVIRLVGKLSELDTNYILEFDERYSHILNFPLEQTQIRWNDTQILQARIKCELSLEQIYHQIFSMKQAYLFSNSYIQLFDAAIKDMKGLLHFEMSYDGEVDRFNLQVEGIGTKWKSEEMPISLVTEKINREWNIVSCTIGEHQIAGKLFQGKHFLELSYIKGKYYESRFLCSNGTFDYSGKKLLLYVDELSIALKDWKSLFPKECTSWASGNILSQGQVKIDFSKAREAWMIEMKLSCNWNPSNIGQLSLKSTNEFFAFFSPKEGLHIEAGALTLLYKDQSCGSIAFDAIDYHKSKWEGSRFIVTLAPKAIVAIASNNLIKDFGHRIDKLYWKDYSFTWENQIRICSSFTYESGQFTMVGTFDSGYYWLGNQSFLFDGLSFSIREECCDLQIKMPVQDRKITILTSIPFQRDKEIHCTILDSNNVEQSILIMISYSEDGFMIKKIKGTLCGLEIDFLPALDKISDKELIQGSIKIHLGTFVEYFPKCLDLFGKQISTNSKYELYGTIALDKKNWQNSRFTGCVRGKNIDILGYQLQSIFGEISLENQNITMQNFSIYDLAMQLRIPNGCLKKVKEQGWQFSFPKIIIRDMRPSLLKKGGIARGVAKPFLITELRCNEVNGRIDNPLSFTGSGVLHFTNSYKTEYNFFSIPMEIISRLGLDISMLVPVQGTLEYAIKEGKIQLLQLKKCYSKGKRSQFHLVHSDPSYIDWNGKLHVNLRIKQYALLKIAELFILSIYGNLESPHISLR